MFNSNVEFNDNHSSIYKNGILCSELQILTKLQLSVICAHKYGFAGLVMCIVLLILQNIM